MVGHSGIMDTDIANCPHNLRESWAKVTYPGTSWVSEIYHLFGISNLTSGGVSIDNEKVGIPWDGLLCGEGGGLEECWASSR